MISCDMARRSRRNPDRPPTIVVLAGEVDNTRPLTRREEASRPRTRGDCINGPRPCPWVSCRHHLFWELLQRRLVETPLDCVWSCALDVADAGEHTLEEIGELFGLTRERIRQIETMAFDRVKRRAQSPFNRSHFESLLDMVRFMDSARQENIWTTMAVDAPDLQGVAAAVREAYSPVPKTHASYKEIVGHQFNRPSIRKSGRASEVHCSRAEVEAISSFSTSNEDEADAPRDEEDDSRTLGPPDQEAVRERPRPHKRRRANYGPRQLERVLSELHVCQDPQTIAELAELSECRKSTVRAIIRRLKTDGLVRQVTRAGWEMIG